MATATFRFHGELNAFLARPRRERAFAHAFAADATLKHAIEALGVPHTEIGRLCVNGAPSALDRPLGDGDRVDIHPQRAQPSAAPALPQPDRWRFVADAHLGGL
ncbi:twitching motility protein PilT, partial [Burkholderia territorii]